MEARDLASLLPHGEYGSLTSAFRLLTEHLKRAKYVTRCNVPPTIQAESNNVGTVQKVGNKEGKVLTNELQYY